MIRGVKHIIPVELYSYTSRSRLHNIVLISYNQNYSKLEGKQMHKKNTVKKSANG